MPLTRVGDVDLHYLTLESSGSSGIPVSDIILVHGLAANLGFWYLRIAPKLATSHRVTMVDLRGHGRSSMPPRGYTVTDMATDLHALMQHAGITRAHLVGHSYGGMVALRVASLFPDSVRSLVLADVRVRTLQPQADTGNWRRWGRYAGNLASFGDDSEKSGMEFGPSMIERIARMRLTPADPSHDRLPPLFAGATGRIAARRWIKLIETTTARAELLDAHNAPVTQLQAIHKPTLLVYGEYSQNVPSAHALARIWRHASVRIVPRAGHFFPVLFPGSLVRAVLDFTGSVEEQTTSKAV